MFVVTSTCARSNPSGRLRPAVLNEAFCGPDVDHLNILAPHFLAVKEAGKNMGGKNMKILDGVICCTSLDSKAAADGRTDSRLVDRSGGLDGKPAGYYCAS